MTMAFVTRCPYCGALWRLPNRDTAELGPVRCSDCQNSFDATCNLVEVPQELFPDMPPAPAPFASQIRHRAPADHKPAEESRALDAFETHSSSSESPATTDETSADEPEAKEVIKDSQEKPQRLPETQIAVTSQPPQPETEDLSEAARQKKNTAVQPEPAAARPQDQKRPQEPTQTTVAPSEAVKDEQLLRLHGMTPGEELQASKPDATLAKIIPAKSKPQAAQAQKIRVADTLSDPTPRARQRQGAYASVLTSVLLLVILASALAVIFNQRLMAAFPQTTPLFHNVCGKIPCPGFYLSDISAFVVSKTNLRAVDESGNYQLEITLINGSDMPQAIPCLDIELVDDSDTTLMHKTLTPSEYLSNPAPSSIAPDRSITVRFSMQTNVTPARCIVNPVYLK